jgi:hypothetical protein
VGRNRSSIFCWACANVAKNIEAKSVKIANLAIGKFIVFIFLFCVKKIVSTNVRKKNQCANTMAGLTEKSVMIGVENG